MTAVEVRAVLILTATCVICACVAVDVMEALR